MISKIVRSHLCLWVLLLGLSTFADEAEKPRATEIPLRLNLPEGVEAPVKAVFRLTPLSGPLAGQSHEIPVQLPTDRRIVSSEGAVNRLELEIDGYWSPSQIVVSRVNMLPVSFDFFRTGTLTGSIQAPQDALEPAALTLRFEQAASRKGKPAVPRGFVMCPINDGRFRCEVPAGLLDLRLRAKGFVSYYLWTFPIPVGGELPLGQVKLHRGGSIVGHVTLEDQAASFEGVTVHATPLQATHDSGEERVRHERLKNRVGVNARGFFHLRGLPAGQYRVVAEKTGYGRALTETTMVHPNAETSLADPFVITPPGHFEVRLEPPKDPFGRAWSLELQESNPSRTAFELVEQGSADSQGVWSSKDLPRGVYALVIEDSVGSRWLREDVELDESEVLVEQNLAGIVVDGRISVGEEPLEATLWFGGRFGERRLKIHSDAEGRFGGMLPEEGDWLVHVEAREPRVTRNIRSVTVETMGAGDAAWVEIELPNHRLAGRVLDAKGQPVVAALLIQSHNDAGRPEQERTDDEGEFELHGLDAGTYTVQAHASQLTRTSQPVQVEITEDREPPFLELRLDESRAVRGKILAPLHAVPGARIAGIPQGAGGEALTQVLPTARSDVQGRFMLTVPKATATIDVVILPPGFALTTTRLTLPDGEDVSSQNLSVHSASGTLRVVVEEDFETGMNRMITVIREGIEIGYPTLLRWARLQQGGWTTPGELMLPRMAFGDYAVCVHRSSTQPTCRSVFLPPGGDIQVNLER